MILTAFLFFILFGALKLNLDSVRFGMFGISIVPFGLDFVAVAVADADSDSDFFLA